jgi:hypothetical protein
MADIRIQNFYYGWYSNPKPVLWLIFESKASIMADIRIENLYYGWYSNPKALLCLIFESRTSIKADIRIQNLYYGWYSSPKPLLWLIFELETSIMVDIRIQNLLHARYENRKVQHQIILNIRQNRKLTNPSLAQISQKIMRRFTQLVYETVLPAQREWFSSAAISVRCSVGRCLDDWLCYHTANQRETVLVSGCRPVRHLTLFTELYICIDRAVSMLRLNETAKSFNSSHFSPLYPFMVHLSTPSVSQATSCQIIRRLESFQ